MKTNLLGLLTAFLYAMIPLTFFFNSNLERKIADENERALQRINRMNDEATQNLKEAQALLDQTRSIVDPMPGTTSAKRTCTLPSGCVVVQAGPYYDPATNSWFGAERLTAP